MLGIPDIKMQKNEIIFCAQIGLGKDFLSRTGCQGKNQQVEIHELIKLLYCKENAVKCPITELQLYKYIFQ